MSKFTPGPWEAGPIRAGDKYIYFPAIDTKVNYDDVDQKEQRANVKLIEITTDMHKFLSDLTKYPESITPADFLGLKEEAWKIIKGVE